MKKLVCGFLCLLMCFSLVGCSGGKSSSSGEETSKNNASFVKNADGNYALYTDSGKKITEFIFKTVSTMMSGSAIVTNSDGQYMIISSDGTILVKYGKYKMIERLGSLYKVTTNSDKKYLLNANGTQITEIKDSDKTYSLENIGYAWIKSNDGTLTTYNALGKKLTTLKGTKKTDDPKISLSADNRFVAIYYNNKEIILDSKDDSKYLSFNTLYEYAMYVQLKANSGTMILKAKIDDNTTYYKYVKSGKISFTKKDSSNVFFDNGNIICENAKTAVNIIVNDEGKKLLETDRKTYENSNSYIENDETKTDVVNFYKDGKKVKSVESMQIYTNQYAIKKGIYILESVDSVKYGTKAGELYYYTDTGKKLINKSFKMAGFFDNNGIAEVSEDNANYYLINTNGKKISKTYSRIAALGDKYYVGYSGDIVDIFDNKGNIITNGNYSLVVYTESEGNKYLQFQTNDSTNDVYSFATKHIIVSSKSAINVSDHFIIVDAESTQYYTLSGKQITIS